MNGEYISSEEFWKRRQHDFLEGTIRKVKESKKHDSIDTIVLNVAGKLMKFDKYCATMAGSIPLGLPLDLAYPGAHVVISASKNEGQYIFHDTILNLSNNKAYRLQVQF